MGSIPLPALDIKPAQPTDALAEYGKVVSLRGMMQQQQLQQQEIQQKQQALTDQHALTTAMSSWDGKNPDDLVHATLQNGGSANAAIGLQQHYMQVRETASKIAKDDADTGKNTLQTTIDRHNQILGHLAPLDGVKDEDLPGHIVDTVEQMGKDGTITNPQELQQWRQNAMQVSQLAQQDPNAAREKLKVLEKTMLGQKEQFQQAQEERKTTAEETTAKTKQQEVQLQTQEMQAKMPGGPLAPPDKTQQDYFIKHPPPGYTGNPLDYLRWRATNAPFGQIIAANAAGSQLNDAAKDQAAEMYHLTGKLPPAARGVAGLAQNRAIMNRAAELYPESMTEGTAEYAANKKSLGELQPQLDKVDAFEKTAGKNLKVFLDQADKITDTGAKFANVPIRTIQRKMLGTEDMAAFDTARTTALTEIGRVLNSANATGVVSDSARGEVQSLIGENATLNGIKSAAKILTQDMSNRHESYQSQIEDIKKRLGVNAVPAGKEKPAAETPTAPTANKPFSFSDYPERKAPNS